jgi:hypothetical protein
MPHSLLVALLVALVSMPARALPPRFTGPIAVRHPTFNGSANTMMYDVEVTVATTGADADHTAIVGYVADDDFTTCSDPAIPWKWARPQTFDTTDTRVWRLYNFVPGEAYRYRIVLGDEATGTRERCGMLETRANPTPRLPDNLAALNFQYEKSGASFDTQYVLFETDDCGAGTAGGAGYYFVAVDPVAETIVWYLDIVALTGLRNARGSGFQYHRGPTPMDDSVLITINKHLLYEWAFDGREIDSWDFAPDNECDGLSGSVGPCIHHDVYKSNQTGNMYLLATRFSDVDPTGTAWEENCGTGTSYFLDDGYQVLDADWSVTDERFLMGDYGYDPTVDGGPRGERYAMRPDSCDSSNWTRTFDPAYGVIEWTHANALSASNFGAREVLDYSIRQWDQVLRFDPATGELLWRLSPHEGYTDWGTFRMAPGVVGEVTFSEQHDVHATGEDMLMMFDNNGDPNGARVLELVLSRRPLNTTIRRSWAIVDGSGAPLDCPLEGTAQMIPGSSHILSVCSAEYAFMELDDPSGNSGTPPPLFVQLPDGTSDPICTAAGPSDRDDILGWHKAFPMASIGSF